MSQINTVASRVSPNPDHTGFVCIRCGAEYEIADYTKGCDTCWSNGAPASVIPMYANAATGQLSLPYDAWISLGEGNTPLLRLQPDADFSGVKVFAKMECNNPTGSHKDRFSAFVVSRAIQKGCRKVICASSGNAGISLAAYCAYAGLESEVVVSPGVSETILGYLEQFGAKITECPSSLARWEYLAEVVSDENTYVATNFALPAVGSAPVGIEAIKLVAKELVADLNEADRLWVVVPSSRGDLAWGIHRGFVELLGEDRTPRICVVEPYARVSAVLEGADQFGIFDGDSSALPSIAGVTVTQQLLSAVKNSGGRAIVVDKSAAESDRIRLWQEGIPCERSSAAAMSAARKLVSGGHARVGDTIVLMITGNGMKGMDDD